MHLIVSLCLIFQHFKSLLSNTIICDGTDNQICPLAEINCIENEDCIIICSSENGCLFKRIQCPTNHDCELHCINPNSQHQCLGISIDATNSSSLLINASMGNVPDPQTMDEAEIYCPINTEITNKTTCNIHCNGNDLMRRIEIYALHGFDDISIQSIGYQLSCHAGINVYCGDEFTSNCIMSNDYPYQCSNKSTDTSCNPTKIETNSPSIYPSVIPTMYGTSEYNDDGISTSIVKDMGMNGKGDGIPEWEVVFCIAMGVILMLFLVGVLCLWRNKRRKRKVEIELNSMAVKHQNDHGMMDEGKNSDDTTKFEGSPLMKSEDD